VGEFVSKKKAGKVLGSELKETLRASGFVIEEATGKKVALSELDLGFGFRQSKKDPFRAVEEKSLRLRKGTTGKEIQFFRKPKAKNGKSNSWLDF